LICGPANELVMELNKKNGMKKTYRFAFEDQPNILQADFSRAAYVFLC